jgi:hypothetical protein
VIASAVREAGGATAAIGSSAIAPEDATEPTGAPALLLAADAAGRTDSAETSARALRADVTAPGAVRADVDVLDAAYRRALAETGPLLVVVDPGDGERARAGARDGTAFEARRADAVRTVDAVVARVMGSLPADAALVVVSTADYRGGLTPGFGPVIVYGGGPGVLSSASTHRDAVVTLPDVSATVLGMLGLDVPEGVTGTRLTLVDDGVTAEERVATLESIDMRARALDGMREPVWFGFLGACLFVLLAAFAVVLARPDGGAPLARSVLAWVLVALLTLPPGSLAAAFGAPSTPRGAWIGLAAGCVAVFGAAFAWRRRDAVSTLGRLAFITLVLIVADQLLGGRLADGTAFSYSALFGVRFYGLGNEGAAVLFGALLAGIGWRVDRYGRDRAIGFLVTGAGAVILAVLPVFGANVGVALWGVAGVVAAYLWVSGRTLTWRVALAALGAVVVTIGIAWAVDMLGQGSHLADFMASVGGGGAGLASMFARKVEISLATVRSTPATVLLPVALVALTLQLARPRGPFGAAVTRYRGVGATIVGVVAASAVAVLTEDSAVAIGGILLLYALATLGVMTLRDDAEGEA